MSETIYHKHHIIPRHAGGTNDPFNIILLTLEEHAEAHRLLWEKYGRLQDKMAWCMLSGKTEEGELIRREMAREYMKNRIVSPETRKKSGDTRRGKKHTPEHVEKMRQSLKGKKRTEETKKRMSEAQKGRKSWNKGKVGIYTEEQKEKMKNTWFKKGVPAWQAGKSLSDEHRANVSKSLRERGQRIREQKMKEAETSIMENSQ